MDKANNASNASEEESKLLPTLQLCWNIFRANWYWFLVSALICLGIGFWFQQKKSRIYQRQAVILIDDSQSSGSSSAYRSRSRNGLNTAMDLAGISVGDNLQNEIFILTSHRLMERVVDSLQLDVDYTMYDNLHAVSLYLDRPFEIKFDTHTDVGQAFRVTIGEDHTFTLDKFKTKDSEGNIVQNDSKITFHTGEHKNTPVGGLSLVSNEAIKDYKAGTEVFVTHVSRQAAGNFYCSELSAAEYDKESSLIVLTANDVNADRAADVLRTLFNVYKQDAVDNKNRITSNTYNFVEERLRLIGEDLSGVESQMAQFKSNNQIIDIQQNAQAYITESSTARQKTLQLETQLTVAKYLTDFLQDQSKNYETVPTIAAGDASFSTLINDYNKLMIERNRLVTNSSEGSPAVRDADRQLASLRSALISSIKSYQHTTELELRQAQANENRLTGQMGTVPAKEKQVLDIKRQQELKSDLYVYLLNKREEAALQMAINEANVRLVEEPLGSNAPVSPKKGMILLISFVIGLCIPAAILWIRRMLDVTITGRKDVENATTIPVIGDIPHWEDSDAHHGFISNTAADSPVVEAFRVVRYGLNFMRHSAKVFIVTSATPGHGKSFISSNLSYILGATGKRALLIDADVRKRDLTKRYGNSTGLTGILADEGEPINLQAAVLASAVSEHTDFLPAGKMPPNPSELLMSDRLDEIVEAARNEYDYVVIDTTPAFSVADANIVNRVADITIFAMRVGVQERALLPDLEEMYKNKKFRNLCIVINDADIKHSYYGNGFGYGYGYGYGYMQQSKQKKKSLLPWKRNK